MPSTFNLIRNSKVFFTTNVDSQGIYRQATANTAAASYQLTVLDGFSFSQGTNSDAISINEAGGNAVRGSRNFNTSLNAAEFSFSTYIRPYVASSLVKTDEAVLWNALLGDKDITLSAVTVASVTGAVVSAPGVLTLSGTAMTNLNTLTIGKTYNLSGVAGVSASQYNSAAICTGITSPTAATFQYLTAPPAATITAQLVVANSIKFSEAVWQEMPVAAGDTDVVTAYSEVTTARSNLNQLQKFALVITVDQVTYALDDCVLDQATIDFGLDGIATIAWTGKASSIRQLSSSITYATPVGSTPGGAGGTITLTGGSTGTITAASLSTKYITNKLSTVSLVSRIGGGGTPYTLALTGGSITISNNVTYVTPNNLGVVNNPIGYYTGNRSISGSLTAYLRTGSGNTAQLFGDMVLAAATSIETKYALKLSIGGSTNLVRVELYGVGAALQIPTIDAQAVMSTTINFNLQGTDNVVGATTSNYDLENTNDLRVRYFSS